MISAAEAFDSIRAALETAGIRFAVGGSWASTAFGEPRFTNDVDILADFLERNLESFLDNIPQSFYVDREEAFIAIRNGRSFNVIHMPTSFKFDFFPAAAFALGALELNRAIYLADTGLSIKAVPFVTPEDILLAKLYWFRAGGEASDVQWRDIRGIVRNWAARLDSDYLRQAAPKIGVTDLLARALEE